ncbi:hypothetical protein FQ082_08315 [Psychrobacter sp. ANT_H56B]|uniref:hypothetical protein n=1 Tax=Psychrobacter sp. ANT_H56B TaxID=2597353 RepID=UPI0011F0EDDF|nr:hypothetical protein [Psychrobacter sp. ANT_H56B]KAA0925446.1 hypothetical protein FQ082_08315 [Psychrobacter sp. ANT_H56B]
MIKQESFRPYPVEILPAGFIYPARYLQLANCTNTVQSDEYFQWWFLDSITEGAKLSYSLRNNKIKDFNLIPFAQNSDWMAYFDGDDCSADPRVIVVDLTHLPSFMIFENFDEWLAKAEQDYW